MEKHQEGQWVIPNPQLPRSFGTMNIVFGAIMLLVGAGSIAWMVFMPVFFKGIQDTVRQQLENEKANRLTKIAELKDQIKTAKTEEEKAQLQNRVQAMESVNPPDLTGFDEVMNTANDPRIVAYTFTELGAGIVLNIAMIISGIGLLTLAEWARRLALAVAWLKIARWVAIVGATTFLVVPITTAKMQPWIRNIQAQTAGKTGRGASSATFAMMSQGTAIFSVVSAVGSALVACVYPVCVIWFLNRPQARAACLAASSSRAPRLGGEPSGP
jgi:hypothetical protein